LPKNLHTNPPATTARTGEARDSRFTKCAGLLEVS
jgi:hypothetical protein